MSPPQEAPRYVAPARALHWITVLGMVPIIAIGMNFDTINTLPDPRKFWWYTLHESLGVTVFVLTLVRLAIRLGNPPPPDPPMPLPMKLAARATHWGMYALMLALPVAGFLGTNAFGFPLNLWWVLPLPNPVGTNVPLAERLIGFHQIGGITMAALVTLHVLAALYHQFVRKDRLIERMV
jgi:cytochrome b561